MTVANNDALKMLGLADDADAAAISAAYKTKRAALQAKQQSAPSPALANKFAELLTKVDAAYQQLQSTANSAGKTGKSPLSQTKLDDLPCVDPSDINRLSFAAGHVLAGRYTIAELIGQGGMGAVYRAHDKNRDEDIAIKILLPSLTNNERALARFMDEARISSKLSHANIVNVYDVQNDGDLYFLTMELLEGQDLRQVMENQKLVGRPIDIEDVKAYLAQICTGLTAAHEHTVHRDIKPENIWLCDDGKLKLMDFGIAQLQSTSRRTQTGAAMGTAYYMAPEQLKGLKDIDGRADQYAVGVLAYELLTGEVPAGAIEAVDALRKDIPKGMAAAIMQSLSPRPENRFNSIDAFAEAIAKGKGRAKSPRQPRTNNGLPTGEGPNKWVVATLVLFLFIGLGAIAGTGVWKDWIPASKAEIAREKAAVAKLQGEIGVLKQRLDTARRHQDNDVRDAQRNRSDELAALSHWQQLTETGIFNGKQIPNLEGERAVGETLLQEGSYSDAQTTLVTVRDAYKALLQEFIVAEQIYVAESASGKTKGKWLARKNAYDLADPQEVQLASAAEATANADQNSGNFTSSLSHWHTADKFWEAAYAAVAGEVADIDRQRLQTAANVKAAAERKAANVKAAAERKAAAKRKAAADQKVALLKELNIEMVTIRGGTFKMGDINEDHSYDLAKPVRSVTVPSFKMSKYEISFAQWDACVSAGACSHRPDDEGWGRGNRPVINVSWKDINNQFIWWLNNATGKRFRLPSEAEWEYAARAGSTTRYYWGDSLGSNRANCEHCGSQWDGSKTAPVGSFSANRFGLYDMHGNVWEWTQDCWDESYRGAPSDGSARTDGDCKRHPLRGGAWNSAQVWFGAVTRFDMYHSSSRESWGFRLVQD